VLLGDEQQPRRMERGCSGSPFELAGIVFLDSDASGGIGVRLKKESRQA